MRADFGWNASLEDGFCVRFATAYKIQTTENRFVSPATDYISIIYVIYAIYPGMA